MAVGRSSPGKLVINLGELHDPGGQPRGAAMFGQPLGLVIETIIGNDDIVDAVAGETVSRRSSRT